MAALNVVAPNFTHFTLHYLLRMQLRLAYVKHFILLLFFRLALLCLF